MDKELLTHYKNTDYEFRVGKQRIILAIGRKNTDFDRLCERLGHTAGTFITACNPQSQLLANTENKSRNRQLATRLEQMTEFYCFSGEGLDRDKQWPPEASFMVLGLSQQTAIDLAREYQQNALVWIEYQQAAVLIDV
ncbi:DUF3293 domain-containing protein [Idiomarina sp. M1R2S28]|uniref:DUF3293 domain-containing protein n=1 Tax=Idiomarina rhizosphaerae TaxID=2961572 RepID=A0A9X2JSF0_9GAMM|nr:DUF3293 domain-containing protein [Idiomarina rhizosphaerae]MCP1340407.1 DUF3293 domain-containing protein [Idiomarina rhizosphaerae]